MKITRIKNVWIAWTNTDLTEGRGHSVPLCVCELRATAQRLGRRGSVQGSDCKIEEALAIEMDNRWYFPGTLTLASKEDQETQAMCDAIAEATKRAKKAGVSEEDLALLSSPHVTA